MAVGRCLSLPARGLGFSSEAQAEPLLYAQVFTTDLVSIPGPSVIADFDFVAISAASQV
jgi:hypothetical protein